MCVAWLRIPRYVFPILLLTEHKWLTVPGQFFCQWCSPLGAHNVAWTTHARRSVTTCTLDARGRNEMRIDTRPLRCKYAPPDDDHAPSVCDLPLGHPVPIPHHLLARVCPTVIPIAPINLINPSQTHLLTVALMCTLQGLGVGRVHNRCIWISHLTRQELAPRNHGKLTPVPTTPMTALRMSGTTESCSTRTRMMGAQRGPHYATTHLGSKGWPPLISLSKSSTQRLLGTVVCTFFFLSVV